MSFSSSGAQFTCTLGNNDEASCLNAKGDDGEYCAWCDVAGFAFCATEDQAEKIEQTLPGAKCDRHSSGDDDTPSNDDAAPTDDNIAPNDDSLPDDFWTCLQKKDLKSCTAASCTWCDSKWGFGLCMTGPTADSASESDFFDCKKSFFEDFIVEDPLDASCVMAYLQDSSPQGCINASDNDGNACEYCSVAGGLANVCLTEEQVDMGATMGVECSETPHEEPVQVNTWSWLRGSTEIKFQDPLDPACLMAFLQDPSEEGCEAADDSDGNQCEFCSFQGTDLCLNEEQAQIGEQFGIECETNKTNDIAYLNQVLDPLDPTCLMAFLQNPTEDGCEAAVDSDGNACEFCSFQGTQLCLNDEQAGMGEQFGIECEGQVDVKDEQQTALGKLLQDPLDPSCLMAFLQDPTEEGCENSVDSDGNGCEFCSYQGVQVCLNQEQAQMGKQFGIECDEIKGVAAVEPNPYDPSCALAFLQDRTRDSCVQSVDVDGEACKYCQLDGALNLCLTDIQAKVGQGLGISCEETSKVDEEDPYDPSCVLAFVHDPTPESCKSATDGAGNPCMYCSLQGVLNLCLTEDQVDAGGTLGLDCDSAVTAPERNLPLKTVESVDLPPDFLSCLEIYDEHECNTGGCTWCGTEVGIGFCMADAAARALSECDFFSCDSRTEIDSAIAVV